MNKKFVNKVILLITFSLVLSGCFASSQKLVDANKIRVGMTKYRVNSVFAFQSIFENPLLPLSYREYFAAEKKEILSDDNNRNVYYVFSNVNTQVTCGWVMCDFGDGRLSRIFTNYNDAVNYIKKTNTNSKKPKKTLTIKQNGQSKEISNDSSVMSQIKKLSKDYKDGKITEEQFEEGKTEILK